MNHGEPDIDALLGGGPSLDDLTGTPRRIRRPRNAPDLTPIPDSEIRLRILDRLSQMHQNVELFDQWTEQLIGAMILVLDYHRPWRREIQVFESNHHAGETTVVAGCKSCSWSYRTDCPTVLAIAQKLGLTQL